MLDSDENGREVIYVQLIELEKVQRRPAETEYIEWNVSDERLRPLLGSSRKKLSVIVAKQL